MTTPFDAILFDTETTNSEPERAEVIQLAWMPYKGFAPMCPVSSRTYGFSGELTWGALATHHILPGELEGKRKFSPAELPAANYLIAHNVDFDWAVVGRPTGRRICTLAMARKLYPKLDSHKLAAVFYFLFGATQESRTWLRGAHDAAADVNILSRVLERMVVDSCSSSLEHLWKFSEEARIPTHMPFGKYKGEPISKVDRGYAKWYMGQPDTDLYLIAAFRRAGLIK